MHVHEYVCEYVCLNMLYLFKNPDFHSYQFAKALFVLPCKWALLKEQVDLSLHQFSGYPILEKT